MKEKVTKVCTDCLIEGMGESGFQNSGELVTSSKIDGRICDACGKEQIVGEMGLESVWDIHFDWELHQLVNL